MGRDGGYFPLLVDREQSLFFFRFREGSARARELWAAKPQESRDEGGDPVSRLPSRAWSFSCLERFARRGKKKERLPVV